MSLCGALVLPLRNGLMLYTCALLWYDALVRCPFALLLWWCGVLVQCSHITAVLLLAVVKIELCKLDYLISSCELCCMNYIVEAVCVASIALFLCSVSIVLFRLIQIQVQITRVAIVAG